ncbi:hypothetical protein O9929_17150 [Vibrio lentus]|nr:hypothetical protein [Vibrio lentus]
MRLRLSTMIVDLNTTYSAINMSNVTVTVDDVVYEGNYTSYRTRIPVIFIHWSSGVLSIRRWKLNTGTSVAIHAHNGDSTHICQRHSDELSLRKAELVDGTLQAHKIL